MKTLHVTIRLGVGPDDDGAFDKCDALDIWHALTRAFPLCHGSAIEVEPVNICDLVADEAHAEGRRHGSILFEFDYDEDDDDAAGEAAADSEIAHSIREGRKS